ncbi:hypothetical protein DL95DRAFT_389528 [Leptodontidium sp. 2 PMI_412]|nr:hypothetical protein DL95DRAFT_389528 [Leptodontidium sp. 2 PMI_412]
MAVEEPLHVLIVGAGFGGLGCAIACRRQGLKVTVFDQVEKFLPLGDSIGFGANSTKLFKRWGILDDMLKIACTAKFGTMYNMDGTELGTDPTEGLSEEKYGTQSIIGHRGHLHMILLEHARAAGAEILSGSKIVDYDVNKPSVILESGKEFIGDVVIASDGVRSVGRQQVLGFFDKPIHSGYAVYRSVADATSLKNDPVAGKFVDNGDTLNIWIGPDVHAVVISLNGGKQINSAITHQDIGDIDEGWSYPGKVEDVLELIKDWDPALKRVWEITPTVVDWKLVYRPCLDKWVTDSGLVAIMGDAAHPFVPTSSQGASQAVEDGATIALCLAKAGKGNIPVALNSYFKLRYAYVAKAQAGGIAQRKKWHENHNEKGELISQPEIKGGMLDSMALWSHDAEKEFHDRCDVVFAEVQADLAGKPLTNGK